MSDVVIRVENISKLYRLGEVGTGSLAHDVNRWWHRVRGKEDPYLKIGEVNDRTKSVSSAQRPESSAKNAKRNLTTEDTEGTERGAGGNQRADSGEFLEGHSQAGLQMDSEKLASIRSANDSRASGEQTGLVEKSAKIGEICGKNAEGLRPGEFWAVKDVSFELRRGELRTPGRSEKEISKKCLGATKVPASGRRRHQCLGLIGHNGAGKTTLLKMLNGLIKPDAGSITMRGRVGALISLGAGFNPILTGREPKGWEARRTSNRRLAQRVQRRGEGANQNIYINGSVLGLTKKEPERRAARRKGAEGRPGGLRASGKARTKSTRRSTRSSTLPRFGNSSTCRCRVIPRGARSARKFKFRR